MLLLRDVFLMLLYVLYVCVVYLFLFSDTATTDIYTNGHTLSLHDALPICIKALVLRVDSPGGSVLASKEIRQALLAVKAKKLPIVVSMANVAASGGYLVSTPANRIFAEPETITGSIGVFGILPSFDQALAKDRKSTL